MPWERISIRRSSSCVQHHHADAAPSTASGATFFVANGAALGPGSTLGSPVVVPLLLPLLAVVRTTAELPIMCLARVLVAHACGRQGWLGAGLAGGSAGGSSSWL